MAGLENTPEKKERFGRNITLEIDLIRHAEKASFDGLLTEKGTEEAAKFGKDLNAKVYHSAVPRAKETAERIAQESPYTPRQREILATEISPEYLEKYGQVTGEDKGDESRALQMYIDTENERPDETTLSSKEVSNALAKTLLHFVDLSARLKEGSKSHIVLVSHSGTIEHLLVDLLDKNRKDFVKEIGGGLKFLEGARFVIHRDEEGESHITLNFRGESRKIEIYNPTTLNSK